MAIKGSGLQFVLWSRFAAPTRAKISATDAAQPVHKKSCKARGVSSANSDEAARGTRGDGGKGVAMCYKVLIQSP